MIFSTPRLNRQLGQQLAKLDTLRQELGQKEGGKFRWMGTLRRLVKASAVEGSTSIEGFTVPEAEAVMLVSSGEAADSSDKNQLAVACYSRAMDHVSVLAADPSFRWLDRVILDLHFDACHFQTDANPGQWRTGPVSVTGSGGRIVYQAPDKADVPALMAEVVDWLEKGDLNSHIAVRAAMTHLHAVSVHPFSDGNGRGARILQSLVLARGGLVSAEFASIEQYLGANTPAYYSALHAAQGDRYDPSRDVTNWVKFCLAAHIDQAQTRLDQIRQAAARWDALEQLAEDRSWPERVVIALEQCLIGGTDRATYAFEADISLATASSDLRRLVDAGLVAQHGRGRSTHYRASTQLIDISVVRD